MTSHPMPAALPNFQRELRWLERLTPVYGNADMYRVERVLQQAVDNLGQEWRDPLPGEMEDTELFKITRSGALILPHRLRIAPVGIYTDDNEPPAL